MFDQTVFNIALAITGFLGGWVLKVVWDAVRDLQEADRNLVDKVNTIEIMVNKIPALLSKAKSLLPDFPIKLKKDTKAAVLKPAKKAVPKKK